MIVKRSAKKRIPPAIGAAAALVAAILAGDVAAGRPGLAAGPAPSKVAAGNTSATAPDTPAPAAAAPSGDNAAALTRTPAGEKTGPAPAAPPADNAAALAPAQRAVDNAARPTAVWSLDDVVRIALSRHPLVAKADADTEAAEARRGQAKAAYYPAVEITGGYSESRTYSSLAGRSFTSKLDSLQGSLAQTIADFGRRSAALDRAGALRDSFRETGRSVRQDVAFAAKVAYFDVLRTGRILAVQKDTVAQRESLVTQSRAFYDAGIRARIDVTRSEANLYGARADLVSAESAVKVARVTLLQRMGIDWPSDFGLSYSESAGEISGSLADWVMEAEGNRPELKALLAQERAAENAVSAARAGHNPVLTASGDYGYQAANFPLQETYGVSVLLTFPVFSGFLVHNQVVEAEALLASTRAQVTEQRRLIRLDVEQAALAVQETAQRIEARRKEKEASDENLRLATARYQVGAGDIIEMIDAQVQAALSDTTLIEALYDREVAIARLLRAIGRSPT